MFVDAGLGCSHSFRGTGGVAIVAGWKDKSQNGRLEYGENCEEFNVLQKDGPPVNTYTLLVISVLLGLILYSAEDINVGSISAVGVFQ
jgi:hypothetical protein